MTYRSVSFLFMGDANTDAENRIINSGTNFQANILKFGHHRSATSSRPVFLTKVQPKTSVIEVGAGNSYGHPTSATQGCLAQGGICGVPHRPEWRCNGDNRRHDIRCQNRTGKQPADCGYCKNGYYAAGGESAEFSLYAKGLVDFCATTY